MNAREDSKILIASALLASTVAFIALPTDRLAVSPLKFTLLLSGIFFFSYLLLTAANLKTKNPGEIVFIFHAEKWRTKAFDAAVNIYGLSIMGLAALLIITDGLLIAFLDLLFNEKTVIGWIALMVSAVLMLTIHAIVRVVILIKYKKWFWRLSKYYEYRKRLQADQDKEPPV